MVELLLSTTIRKQPDNNEKYVGFASCTNARLCIGLNLSFIFITVTNIDVSYTELCPPGQISENGATPCELCPGGTYQDVCGQTVCKQCDPGLTSSPGSDSVNDCFGERYYSLEMS